MIERSQGPGNVVLATVESEHVTEVFTAFGEKGLLAEAVANKVANEVNRYVAAGVPVGEHLADQLLLPMALGGGGVFRTVRPSAHFTTQVALLRLFLGMDVVTTEDATDAVRVEVPASRRLSRDPGLARRSRTPAPVQARRFDSTSMQS